jgi:hypothetical protein
LKSVAEVVTLNAGKIVDMASNIDTMGVNHGVILSAISTLNAWMDGFRNNQVTMQNKQIAEIQTIRTEFHGEINSLRSEVVNQSKQTNTKLDSKFDQMMATFLATSVVAAPVTLAPAPTTVPPHPAPAHIQQQIQQTQHVLNTLAPSLLAPSALNLSAPLLPTSSLPVSSVTPVVAPVGMLISVEIKDNFKPTHRDKQNQNVFDFARQFYRATKDKPLERIENALMNLESNDSELHDLLFVRTATGPSAHLSGTSEE